MRTFFRAFFLLSFGLAFLTPGCRVREAQMKQMTAPESESSSKVLEAAEEVIKERYYQVKVYKSSGHIIALTPIELVGNHPVRKKIDIWVFLENGFYMPKVYVRKFIDVAEPPYQKGKIAGNFPPEIYRAPPAATEDWHPLIYDRNEGHDIYLAILERLKIPS